MNERSLAYAYIKNQPLSSVIDDPFDLKGAFAGKAKMSNEQLLQNNLQDLVMTYAKHIDGELDLTLDMIPVDEQLNLIRLYLDANGRDLTECVNGNDYSIENDYTCALLAMLKNDCPETREQFAIVTRNNLITHYTDVLNDLLYRSCVQQMCEAMDEQGYMQRMDSNSGEVYWGRF